MKHLACAARTIVVLYIALLVVFSFDAFEGGGSFFEKTGRFLLHLAPAAATSAVLAVAWRFRLVGGLLMIVLGLVFTINFRTDRAVGSFMLVSAPLMLAGLLFIFSHRKAGRPAAN